MTNELLNPLLSLSVYSALISLYERYPLDTVLISSEKELTDIMDFLLDTLIRKEGLSIINKIPETPSEKRMALRALLNVRPPGAIHEGFIKNIDKLLQYELANKTIFDCNDFLPVSEAFPNNRLKHPDLIFLWKGDITSLKADAIVNAANDRMLGCFQPLHNCIDNVIHSAAGPLLREDCKTFMDIQGGREKTGDVKITRGYNLPSRYVIHTVGPIIRGDRVSDRQREELASCYKSPLILASNIKGIKSIAFPCISTGVFNFPAGLAAEIAVKTADEWLDTNPHHFTHVIFNVFLEEDFYLYERIFRE
jgi:O-acetyl-ADP-ribose deacetylase (regulator of RNase III)